MRKMINQGLEPLPRVDKFFRLAMPRYQLAIGHIGLKGYSEPSSEKTELSRLVRSANLF